MNSPRLDLQPEPSENPSDILIVDDVPDNIRFLSDFLLQQGYQIRKAITGQMALTATRALAPDLILLDVNLPDINGYEICRRLKADSATSSIPIIFLSAGNESIDKVKAFQMGAADYITKPFSLEEVLARIQTQLTIRGLQKELIVQNQQLKYTLKELKTAQAGLVQQEKMAILRKIVAGVAHEINNPLSFIACNLKPIQEYSRGFLTLIQLYQQKYPDSDPDIATLLEEMDLEFIRTDLDNIINSIKTGAERINTVVLALRIFTRLDESGIKQVNIHESIKTALELLQHRLHSDENGGEIKIIQEYANLPLVTGHADQLNQVIFNILNNAFDAVEEKIKQNAYDSEVPTISISTELEGSHRVSVRIQDNGVGIPLANQPLIFEPFFTTKPAGRGVGLGLATSKRIIEELHDGCLTCSSSPGLTTEFLFQLPLDA